MPPKIIDTHVHIWNFEKAEYNWLKNNRSVLNRNYDIEELNEQRVKAGVTAGVLIQAANNFEDTDWMLTVAEETDWITGVVGWVPLNDPVAAAKALDRYTSNKYFKGVRHLIHDEPDTRWLLQKEVIESLEMLSSYNLPYDIVGVLPDHIETALALAAKVPGLKMVFNHLNQPPVAAKEKFGVWGELMNEAASHPNFYVKISGLGTCSKNVNWTAGDIKPYVEFALEKFGAERCMCGGDWPVCLLSSNYQNTWSIYGEVINSLLNEDDADSVFYEVAKGFYGLP